MGLGGGTDKASKAAADEQKKKEAAIKQSQDGINAAYNSPARAADIASYVDEMRKYFMGDLNEQKADNDRNMKFALARSGQIGGSTQIDQQKRAGETYNKGVLEVERKSKGAGAELESADQDARLRLISMATQGLDAQTGAQQAAAGMRSALQSGKSSALANGLGDLFSSYKTAYDNSEKAAVRRKADFDAYGGFYAPSKLVYGGG